MELNAGATFLFFKYAAQNMIKQGRGGRIIGGTGAFALQGTVTRYTAACLAHPLIVARRIVPKPVGFLCRELRPSWIDPHGR